MADAMEAAWQYVEQEAADKLIDGERHDLLAIRAVTAIVLIAEGDAVIIEGDQAAVRDGDPMRIARQVGEHRFRTGERALA